VSKESRILVVAPSWVGDMVMSHTMIRLLSEKNPRVVIDVLAPASTLPLASRMKEVHQKFLMETGHGELLFDYRWKMGQRLAREKYSQAIVLPNSLKSALIPFFAGIENRTGYRGEYRYFLINDMRMLNKTIRPLMIQRFAGLALREGKELPDELPFPKLSIDDDNRDRLVRELGLQKSLSEGKPIGICPGAEYGPAKKWPETHYASLIRKLTDKGNQVWILGSKRDVETGRVISQMAGDKRCHDLTGKTGLLDVVDLISLCNTIVTNDSGLMHIACALDVKTIAVYGSTTPGFTPPLSKKASVVSLNLSCSPCFKRECPLGHTNCLNQLQPDLVLDYI